MKTEYRGHVIDIATKEESGLLWAAVAWIWPAHSEPGLNDAVEVSGYKSETEAVEAAQLLSEKRIDTHDR